MCNEVELEQFGIIAYLPENSISATITAKFMNDDDEIMTAESCMSPEDIYAARKDFEEIKMILSYLQKRKE